MTYIDSMLSTKESPIGNCFQEVLRWKARIAEESTGTICSTMRKLTSSWSIFFTSTGCPNISALEQLGRILMLAIGHTVRATDWKRNVLLYDAWHRHFLGKLCVLAFACVLAKHRRTEKAGSDIACSACTYTLCTKKDSLGGDGKFLISLKPTNTQAD